MSEFTVGKRMLRPSQYQRIPTGRPTHIGHLIQHPRTGTGCSSVRSHANIFPPVMMLVTPKQTSQKIRRGSRASIVVTPGPSKGPG